MAGLSVAVISADFGRYHQPSPFPAQSVEHTAALVTDMFSPLVGWQNIVVEPSTDPRMASKQVKCHPEPYILYTDADVVIWVDAQVAVTGPGFVSWCLDHLGDGDLAAMRHPAGRHSILAEARAGRGPQGRGRFAGQDTLGQARHYIAQGHPDCWGLWWTTIIVRRLPETVEFGARWLAEQQRWSTHDQVSFPHVARTTVGQVIDLPIPHPDLCQMLPRRPALGEVTET